MCKLKQCMGSRPSAPDHMAGALEPGQASAGAGPTCAAQAAIRPLVNSRPPCQCCRPCGRSHLGSSGTRPDCEVCEACTAHWCPGSDLVSLQGGAAELGWVQVVYRWAQGTKFGDLCLLTPVVEGSIVRSAPAYARDVAVCGGLEAGPPTLPACAAGAVQEQVALWTVAGVLFQAVVVPCTANSACWGSSLGGGAAKHEGLPPSAATCPGCAFSSLDGRHPVP